MGRFFLLLVSLVPGIPVAAQSFLVLPFVNFTNNEKLNWVGESISESLADGLASEGILVVDRADREKIFRKLAIKPNARLTRATILKVAMDLDASFVIFGQFEQPQGELRILSTAFDVKKLAVAGDSMERGPLAELGSLETRLAWQMLQLLAPDIAPTETEYLRQRPTVRFEALEQYIAGLTASDDESRLKALSQATQLDPNFLLPAFQLGRVYFQRKQYEEAALWLTRIHASDVHYRQASFYLGVARYHIGDFRAATQAFEVVAQAVPLNEVLNNLGAAQSRLGLPEALSNFEKALEGDEADPDYHFNVGYALLRAGDTARAADRFRAVVERNPSDAIATEMLGRSLRPDGDVPGGRERLKTNYQEAAFFQLKALLNPAKKK